MNPDDFRQLTGQSLNSDPNSVLMNELDEMVGTFDLITDFGTLGEAENGSS